jgi:hypothetical protein
VATLPGLEIVSLRRFYNDGRHNAFTDLTWFRGALYLAFRNCPDGHMVFESSRILVWRSRDGVRWEQVYSFGVPARDVRDPHFLVLGARLFVYSGTWLVATGQGPDRDINDHLGFAAWSDDGATWQGPAALPGTEGHYIWRAAQHAGVAYLCGRRKRDLLGLPNARPEDEIVETGLLISQDGLAWTEGPVLRESWGDETALCFDPDGGLVALCRGIDGYAPAQVRRGAPPYVDWQVRDLPLNVQGPLLAPWGAWAGGAPRYLVGGRNVQDRDDRYTALYWLVEDALAPALRLPSGGDNSYPGLALLDERHALLSYYSSHEADDPALPSAGIYLAELRLVG